MTAQILKNFEKICRCCLCKNGEMQPLFGCHLDNMLRFVAGIEIQAGDGLPELMCVPCVLQVSRAFTFKQQCRRSDTTLKNYLQGGYVTKETDNNNVDEMYSTIATQDNRTTHENTIIEEAISENETTDHQFTAINNENRDNGLVESDLVLDSLPPEIESDAFEEEIELSSLPSESQFSTVAGDDIEKHLADDVMNDENSGNQTQLCGDRNLPAKFSGYFDQIKLEVETLSHTVMPSQSIAQSFVDNISHVDDENSDKKMPSDDFIEEILATDKLEVASNFNCTECNSVFDTKDELAAHIQSHPHNSNSSTKTTSKNDKKRTFECNECFKVFAENKILKRHLKIHSPIKPFVCKECNMSFTESSNLSKHMKKHTGELRNVVGKPNLCSVCGKGFKWSSSLSKHMKHHTLRKILNCPYCPKYYVEARSLNIHLRSHTGERPFVCEICKKGFTQMGNLEKHMRVHTGERPYSCPICHKGFSQSGYVAIHLRTHTGDKPYRCDVENCGRAFAGSNTLAIHKRTHTGERPYACGICDKSFARQETANIHQRTHTGEKPHVCKICQRGFTSSGHLTGHMRSHSGTKTHECKVCQKRFAGSSSLKVHMKSHTDKATQQPQQHQEQEIFDAKNTIFECNMCKMTIPTSALSSFEELQAYNHEFIDDVLICSNVTSIIDNNGKIIEEIHDENGTNIILTTATDIENGQQLLIDLSDLK